VQATNNIKKYNNKNEFLNIMEIIVHFYILFQLKLTSTDLVTWMSTLDPQDTDWASMLYEYNSHII